MAMRRTGCRGGQDASDVDGCAASGLAQAKNAASSVATIEPIERGDGWMLGLRVDIMHSPLLGPAVWSAFSHLAAQGLCGLDHDLELLRRQLSADCHQAAVGRKPDLIRRQMLEH